VQGLGGDNSELLHALALVHRMEIQRESGIAETTVSCLSTPVSCPCLGSNGGTERPNTNLVPQVLVEKVESQRRRKESQKPETREGKKGT